MMLHPDADSFVIMAVYHSFCATATIVKHLHTEFISGTRLFLVHPLTLCLKEKEKVNCYPCLSINGKNLM